MRAKFPMMFCRQMDSFGNCFSFHVSVPFIRDDHSERIATLFSIFHTTVSDGKHVAATGASFASSMTGSIKGERLPRNCHIPSPWSVVMMVVGWVVNTDGLPLLCLPPHVRLALLLLLEVTSALGQTHTHHVAVEDLGREQSCSHPAHNGMGQVAIGLSLKPHGAELG